ncbi:MAG: peptide chain release factor N(5)-glutamine methyltransferase [Winogradskyella sp.]|uniref:peptide chain release factor N(5)-glutamine methyltransferase n=1 Tax=Winogradskyella sp. TaxID=1883156 RepID=UPI00183E7A3B|nr:peptide chain release factor N(5)-glutamine methyltransferase [Winogradskyella sp.]
MLLKDIKAAYHENLDGIYGKVEVDNFFYLSTAHYLGLQRYQLVLQPKYTISKSENQKFSNTINDLKQNKPIQYILGETEFYGLPFKVNKDVLIPRPETEELVDLIITNYKSQVETPELKILDIGTGSGCIAVSLAKHLPNAKVYAIDVSNKALNVAKQNATLNEVEIVFSEGDILNIWQRIDFLEALKFDIIVSNPPYVRHLEKQEINPNVLDYEPHIALFVEDNNPLEFYKAITDFAIDRLKKKGSLYFEINQYLGEATKALLVASMFTQIELKKDLNGNYRILKGTII